MSRHQPASEGAWPEAYRRAIKAYTLSQHMPRPLPQARSDQAALAPNRPGHGDETRRSRQDAPLLPRKARPVDQVELSLAALYHEPPRLSPLAGVL